MCDGGGCCILIEDVRFVFCAGYVVCGLVVLFRGARKQRAYNAGAFSRWHMVITPRLGVRCFHACCVGRCTLEPPHCLPKHSLNTVESLSVVVVVVIVAVVVAQVGAMAGFEFGSGIMSNGNLPEQDAQVLRDVQLDD